MTSDPITRLNSALEGRYRIERELGEGGMATVYLADDLKHERKVALKVLKPELAAVVGAERFLAEIKTTANLQHPHILPLHDSGEADGFLFYVMPYIEGESLADRLAREKQLPVGEAVRIATDVAEALHSAHQQGVIHRDIKPANILLSQGRPLIADFGIALAVSAAGGGRMTETGLSMGTPYYMSPEQASADREPTAASDVYSLGCVLYEMLVGDPPYVASTAQAILAKILMGDAPQPSDSRASIPPNVDAATRRSLERLPADRFASAQAFANALADPGFRHREATFATATAPHSGSFNRLSVATTGLSILLAAALAWTAIGPSDQPAAGVPWRTQLTGLDLAIPDGGWRFDLSADGERLVVGHAPEGSEPALYVREAGGTALRMLPNTEGASQPTISPDGEWVAFSNIPQGTIQRVPILGGEALPIANGLHPHWGLGDTIVFERESALYMVGGSGGEPELLLESDTIVVRTPYLLPNGRAVLFQRRRAGGLAASDIMILDLETREPLTLIEAGGRVRYLPTGHLVYGGADRALMGIAFDQETLQKSGSPITLIPEVANGRHFTTSESGTLVYLAAPADRQATPVWVERDGSATVIDPDWPPHPYTQNESSLALSPDGSRLAVSWRGDLPLTSDIHVKQLDTGPLPVLTLEGARNRRPAWHPNGQDVLFISNREGQQDIWSKQADGVGSAEPVLSTQAEIEEAFYSRDGAWLIYREGGGGLGDDILAVRTEPSSEPIGLATREHNEQSPALSPDSRWLAYVSDESGRDEVYVQPFPEGTRRWPISADGGFEPLWARDGSELFYRNGADELVAVPIRADSTFAWDAEQVLFSTQGYAPLSGRHQTYDVGPDGRFVMLRVEGRRGTTPDLFVVTNWFTELLERMGGN